MSIWDLRREFEKHGIRKKEMASDPIRQFDGWFQEAVAAGVPDPNAMTLATCGEDGMPSARVVLLKGYDERGLSFFTNYESRKGRELEVHPRAALAFFWQQLDRQVRVCGVVERVTREESEMYFRSRPRGSQLGAWASAQSQTVEGREDLEKRYEELAQQYKEQDIPLPTFWGGYRVVPVEVEFWQGRLNRLHDRLRYRRNGEGRWTIERLSP